MKFFDLWNKVEKNVKVVTGAIFVILSGLGFSFNSLVTSFVLIGLVILIIIIIMMYETITRYNEKKRSMSQSNLKANAKKHSKTILKFEKSIRKRLEKHKNVNYNKKKKNQIDLINAAIINETTILDENTYLDEDKKNVNDTIKVIKSTSSDQIFILADILNQSIISLESTLLQSEQYKTRIKLGHFLSIYSFNSLDIQKAYIDLIGWTNLLKGDFYSGIEAIEKGISIASNAINENMDEKLINKSKFNIIRGYRHLGSYKYILLKKPKNALAYSLKGLEEFNKLNKEDYTDKEYNEMDIGLKYGIKAANYYLFKNKINNFKATKEDFNYFVKSITNIDEYIKIAQKFENNHRLIKLYLLKINYLELIYEYKNRFNKHLDKIVDFDSLKNQLNDNLDLVSKQFKKNMFNDDSLEHYLNSKVKQLTSLLEDELKGGKKWKKY